MGIPPKARVSYTDEQDHQQWYELQAGESHDPVSGLINPGGRTVLEAAKGLTNLHDTTQPQTSEYTSAPTDDQLTSSLSLFLKLTQAADYVYDEVGKFYSVSEDKLKELLGLEPKLQQLVDVRALRIEVKHDIVEQPVSGGDQPQGSGIGETSTVESTNLSEGEKAVSEQAPVETKPAAPIAGTVVAAPKQPILAAATTAQPTPVKAPTPPLSALSGTLEKAKAEATTVGKMALDQIAAYMDAMAPKKPQTPQTGVRHQVQLYRTLTMVINKLDSDFFLVWGAILKVFHEQKNGVFHETAVFRFPEHITLAPDDQKAFHRLLNLIKITADPQSRNAATRQVDFKRTLEFGVTEAGRVKLLNFYNK